MFTSFLPSFHHFPNWLAKKGPRRLTLPPCITFLTPFRQTLLTSWLLQLSPHGYTYFCHPTSPENSNFAARLVLLAPRHHHSTPLLEKLHKLPISERIKYKVACMCFNAMNGYGPAYLSELLHVYNPYTTLFFWHPHAGNPTIQTQGSWLSHLLLLWTPYLEFTPTRL